MSYQQDNPTKAVVVGELSAEQLHQIVGGHTVMDNVVASIMPWIDYPGAVSVKPWLAGSGVGTR